MSTAVWWIRRDLRLTGNQSLASALACRFVFGAVLAIVQAVMAHHLGSVK
jgi:deoxyribodipyrimidine photolyase